MMQHLRRFNSLTTQIQRTCTKQAPTIILRTFTSLSHPTIHSSTTTSCTRTPAHPLVSHRLFSTTRSLHGLEEFFVNSMVGEVGRSWTVNDLRLKSFEDLQKLWFVLLKERNMLYTYQQACKRSLGALRMEQPDRIPKVRRSMKAIKVVLYERYCEYKRATDPLWVARRGVIQERRRVYKARIKRRTSLPKHKQPRISLAGIPPHKQSNQQKYGLLKRRDPKKQPPPEGEFPPEMVRQQQVKGHGQTPEALIREKVKKDKEYF